MTPNKRRVEQETNFDRSTFPLNLVDPLHTTLNNLLATTTMQPGPGFPSEPSEPASHRALLLSLASRAATVGYPANPSPFHVPLAPASYGTRPPLPRCFMAILPGPESPTPFHMPLPNGLRTHPFPIILSQVLLSSGTLLFPPVQSLS